MEYRVTLADTSDPTAETTVVRTVTKREGQSAEEAAELLAHEVGAEDGHFYLVIHIERGE